MIASYGGMEIDSKGNRNFAGSGGMIGGLSFPNAGLAKWAAVGNGYYRFTPANAVPSPTPNIPELPNPNFPYPQPTEIPTIPSPTNPSPTNPTTSGPKGGVVTNCLWGDCSGNVPTISILPKSILDLLGISDRTKLDAPPRLFQFNPETGSNTMNVKPLILLAIVAVVGYFIYTKYVKK